MLFNCSCVAQGPARALASGITFRSLRYRLEKHHLDPGDIADAALEA